MPAIAGTPVEQMTATVPRKSRDAIQTVGTPEIEGMATIAETPAPLGKPATAPARAGGHQQQGDTKLGSRDANSRKSTTATETSWMPTTAKACNNRDASNSRDAS